MAHWDSAWRGAAAFLSPLPAVAALAATGRFSRMSASVDEAEHSIEMHLPYIVKAMEGYAAGRAHAVQRHAHRPAARGQGADGFWRTRRRTTPYTIVPILVGNLDSAAEADYGRLLAPYLADPRTLFVVSSDFCHWGARFSYRHVDKAYPTIHEGIEALDRRGMRVRDRERRSPHPLRLGRVAQLRAPAPVAAHARDPVRPGNRAAQPGRVRRVPSPDRQYHLWSSSYRRPAECRRRPAPGMRRANGRSGARARPLTGLRSHSRLGRSVVGQANPTGAQYQLKFTKYAQSNRATKPSDSSVSYASAVLTSTTA